MLERSIRKKSLWFLPFAGRLLCFFVLVLVGSSQAQNVTLQLLDTRESKVLSKLDYRRKFSNKQDAYKELENVIKTLQFQGYLLAEVDTTYGDSLKVFARVSEHQLFRSARLGIGNLNPVLASKLGISEKLYLNKPYRYREVAKTIDKIISYYENNGYPFASVKLDSLQITENTLSAVLNVQKNKLYKIDSIKVVGSARVNENFLNRYLQVKENMLYDEAVFLGISRKLKQLPFVVETQGQRVQLTQRTNKLILFLDKKNASQFDGIIGLLPDANTGKTIVTGDVKIKLVNGIFRNGETFDLEWRRLKSQTQDFFGRVNYPYLFRTPVGIDYSLKIYQRDTTFIDINNNIGLNYYFDGLNNVKVFYKQRNSNLISTNGLEFISALPEYADIQTQSYGAGIFLEKLDYRFNPRKGYSILVNAQTGNRLIKKNAKINPELYEGLLLRSTQYQSEGTFAFFLPLSGRSTVRVGIQGATVFGNSSLFKNELFRIGGLKTLRGFDEESIFASTYVIPTLEYRFLFSQNSNILLFMEGAWYENTSKGQYDQDTPVSVGAGINFETKAGILTLNYGLGNQRGNGFDLRNGKIHFGLTALF